MSDLIFFWILLYTKKQKSFLKDLQNIIGNIKLYLIQEEVIYMPRIKIYSFKWKDLKQPSMWPLKIAQSTVFRFLVKNGGVTCLLLKTDPTYKKNNVFNACLIKRKHVIILKHSRKDCKEQKNTELFKARAV